MLSIEQRMRMLKCPDYCIDVVLDTDAYNEVDDQFAISLALFSKEKIRLKALLAAPFHNARSSSPEDGMLKSYEEIEKLLRLADSEVPVFKGAREYLHDEQHPASSPASVWLAEVAKRYSPDNPLYVVGIAAITNIASSILISPEIADNIVVVWLGGHSFEWENNSEFNCRQDVAAARVVFSCGAPLVMLPCMGVASSFTTSQYELEHWFKGKNLLADYLQKQAIDEANTYAKGCVWTRVIWDVTAIGWLLNHKGNLMYSRYETTPIPTYEHHWAHDPKRPLCRYVYYINRDALYREMVEKVCNEC